MKLDLGVQYRRKRYENSPESEYDQVRIAPGLEYRIEDLLKLEVSAGINDFNYLKREDEKRKFGKAQGTGYLLDKKLTVSGGYKIEMLDERQQDRYRVKNVANAGLKYKADIPWLESVSGRAEAGRGNTKDEDTDIDLDYRYWKYNLGTWHRISGAVKTDWSYEFLKKDYLAGDFDFSEFMVANGWSYEWLTFDLKHKEVTYKARVNSNYRRETLGIGARYTKRMDWNARAEVEGNFYRYENGSGDKDRYYVTVGGEKVMTKRFRVGLELKMRYNDYKNQADKKDAGVRVTGEWKY